MKYPQRILWDYRIATTIFVGCCLGLGAAFGLMTYAAVALGRPAVAALIGLSAVGVFGRPAQVMHYARGKYRVELQMYASGVRQPQEEEQ